MSSNPPSKLTYIGNARFANQTAAIVFVVMFDEVLVGTNS